MHFDVSAITVGADFTRFDRWTLAKVFCIFMSMGDILVASRFHAIFKDPFVDVWARGVAKP